MGMVVRDPERGLSVFSDRAFGDPTAGERECAQPAPRSCWALPARRYSNSEKLRLQDLVVGRIRAFLQAEGCSRRLVSSREEASGAWIEAGPLDLSLAGLCDFQERLLRMVLDGLHADELGWQNAARVQRVIEADHPRFTHDEALRILRAEGLNLALGAPLSGEAEAVLVRRCGDLPVQITYGPMEPGMFDARLEGSHAQTIEWVEVVLPGTGTALTGVVRAEDRRVGFWKRRTICRAACRISVARLLHYALDGN